MSNDATLHVGVHTTFMPWLGLEMSDAEYRDLDRQGLIIHDTPAAPVEPGEPAPVQDEAPAEQADKTPAPSPVPGGRRSNRD